MKRMESSRNTRNREVRSTFELFCILTTFVFLLSGSAFAGWTKDSSTNAWRYDLGNSDYYKDSWQWIDGNGDKISECYYFDQNGWMYANTRTPDGFTVNENGAWTINGVVQTKINFDNYLDGWKALHYEGKKYWCYYANGVFYTNTTTPDGYTVDSVGRWVVNGVPQEYVERNTNSNANTNVSNSTSNTNNTTNLNNTNHQQDQINSNDFTSFEETNDEYREKLIELANEYREENGLTPFSIDEDNDFAQVRAKELPIKYSHIRPNGGMSVDVNRITSEIIYRGKKDPRIALNAWKNSPQHNKVLLKKGSFKISTGYYADAKFGYWVILLK